MRVRDFQAKLRRPLIEQQQKQQTANWQARAERDRLRQERNRRAAGIPPRGAQEALDEAMGLGRRRSQVVCQRRNPERIQSGIEQL